MQLVFSLYKFLKHLEKEKEQGILTEQDIENAVDVVAVSYLNKTREELPDLKEEFFKEI